MNLKISYLLATGIFAGSMLYFNAVPGLSASPAVTITSIEGKQYELALSGGKARLVSFYSPNCPISSRDIASLKSAHNRLKDEPFDVIAIAMPYDKAQEIAQLKETREINYPIAHDVDGTIGDAFPNVRFTPTTFLIDTNGQIVWRNVGQLDNAQLNSEIDALLAQRVAGKG